MAPSLCEVIDTMFHHAQTQALTLTLQMRSILSWLHQTTGRLRIEWSLSRKVVDWIDDIALRQVSRQKREAGHNRHHTTRKSAILHLESM